MSQTEQTLYERVGGEATFRRLVDAFYDRVEQDAVLRPLFPDDLTPGKEWQFMFLMQYWGGPTRYMEERGHPRLRMRHFPFAITPQARDAWVRCMFEAIDEIGIAEPDRTEMRTYFDKGATFMINRYEEASE